MKFPSFNFENEKEKTIIVGHRGARLVYPENTLIGFRYCLNNNINNIELDIHLTKDNKIVVIHDSYLERIIGLKRSISDIEYSELKNFTVLESNEKIPLLSDVLKILGSNFLELHIEIKTDILGRTYKNIIKLLMKEIENINKRVILTSFSLSTLKYIRSIDKNIPLILSISQTSMVSYGGLFEIINMLNNIGNSIMVIEKKLLYKIINIPIIDRNIGNIGVWTINKIYDAEFWLNRGVRQITSDNPKMILEHYNKR